MESKDIYEITLKKEVIGEVASQVLAVLDNYFDNRDIELNDIKEPVVRIYREILTIKKEILKEEEYDNIEKLNRIEGFIYYINKSIKGLE